MIIRNYCREKAQYQVRTGAKNSDPGRRVRNHDVPRDILFSPCQWLLEIDEIHAPSSSSRPLIMPDPALHPLILHNKKAAMAPATTA